MGFAPFSTADCKKKTIENRGKSRIDIAEVSVFIGLLSGELLQRNRRTGMGMPGIWPRPVQWVT
jgi:hypothetical protein